MIIQGTRMEKMQKYPGLSTKKGEKRLVAPHECLQLKTEQNQILNFWHTIIHVNAVTMVSMK